MAADVLRGSLVENHDRERERQKLQQKEALSTVTCS